MTCRTGRHDRTDPTDARRCCSGKWRRELRIAGDEGDLDPIGRQSVRCGPYLLIYGWAHEGPAIRRGES